MKVLNNQPQLASEFRLVLHIKIINGPRFLQLLFPTVILILKESEAVWKLANLTH